MIKLDPRLQGAAKTLKAHLLDPDTLVAVSHGVLIVHSATGRQEYDGLMPHEWAGYRVEWRYTTDITLQGATRE